MSFKTTIYRLKQRYGADAVLEKHSNSSVDVTTGVENSFVETISLGKIPLLPVGIMISVGRQLRIGGHPSGAFYTKYSTFALLEYRMVKDGLSVGDILITKDRVFTIAEVSDLHGKFLYEVGLTDITVGIRS